MDHTQSLCLLQSLLMVLHVYVCMMIISVYSTVCVGSDELKLVALSSIQFAVDTAVVIIISNCLTFRRL
jgi:hypothetical protein